MTEQQFDSRMKQIEEQAAAKRQAADAFRDQELARLFESCEWTQEKIARKLSKSQSWVSYRLTFARFLSFMTRGHKQGEQLTEKVFRALYSKTRGKEPERFKAVLAKLDGDIPLAARNQINKPGYRAAVLEILETGKWKTIAQILAEMAKLFAEVDKRAVTNAVRHIATRPPAGKQMESKKITQCCQYRLRDFAKGSDSVAPETITNLVEGIGPIIEELKQWGRANELQMSPSAIRRLAVQLERLFDPLMKPVAS